MGVGEYYYAGGGAHTKHVCSLLVWHGLISTIHVYETAFKYNIMLLPHLRICVCLLIYFYIQLAIYIAGFALVFFCGNYNIIL